MIKNENVFLNILYVVRLEPKPTVSTLTAIRSIISAKCKQDSDEYRIRKKTSL